MKFQRCFAIFAIIALCLLQTIDSRTETIRTRRQAIDFCAEDTEFPAWKNFYAFVKVISHSVCKTESLQILLYILGQ